MIQIENLTYQRGSRVILDNINLKIEKGEWKRVLFVPTGALMSTVTVSVSVPFQTVSLTHLVPSTELVVGAAVM